MIIRIETDGGLEVEIELRQNGTAVVTTGGRSMGFARWHQKDQHRLDVFALPRQTFDPPMTIEPEPPGLHFKFRRE